MAETGHEPRRTDPESPANTQQSRHAGRAGQCAPETQRLRSLPLWPLALLAALLALWLAVRVGLAPACNPFFDGCI